MLIEQAIYTSAQTDRTDGYQLVARSSGISEPDARELGVWGPSHDSLVDLTSDAVSINFHPLPSGNYCVSKTTPAGEEYSGRQGSRIYTQCLILDTETLARFGNNPFAVITAAFAQGSLRLYDKVPDRLEPFRLTGRAAVIDQALLAQLSVEHGATWLGAVVGAALATPSLTLVARQNRSRLMAGLINLLPVEVRPRFSFSTGLKFSPRRPFRIVGLDRAGADQRRATALAQGIVLELGGHPPQEFTDVRGWSGFIASVLATGRTSFLNTQLTQVRTGLDLPQVDALGEELLERLEAATQDRPTSRSASTWTTDSSGLSQLNSESSPDARRADAPHDTFQGNTESATAQLAALSEEPSIALSRHVPAAFERLQLVEDTVFEAVVGKPGALTQLRSLWTEILLELGPHAAEEAREQYLRHALNVWRECAGQEEVRQPALSVSAMEVVWLLHNG